MHVRLALLIAIQLILLYSPLARAQYPTAKKNATLREEVESDTQRLIPLTKHFAFAVDGETYFRNLGSDDFYHGVGYWMQIRSEARPIEAVSLNVRSIVYAGSCSTGYAEPGGGYHLLGLSATDPHLIFGGKIGLRMADLDRQTFGEGLLVQEKEMNGALVSWQRDNHYVLVRTDGTGLFRVNDDTYNTELGLWAGAVGLGNVSWPQGQAQDHLTHDRVPYNYVFSRMSFDWFSYGLEAGTRQQAFAGLLALKTANTWGGLSLQTKLEARRYNSGFAEDFAGQVQQQYISYDQYDKAFTNAANVFVTGDDVTVAAAHLNARMKISEAWRLHSLNESGRFDFKSKDSLGYYYFRQGTEYCPFEGREDCLDFYVSNKVLTDSFARPPSKLSTSNSTLFKAQPFFGLEARFRF